MTTVARNASTKTCARTTPRSPRGSIGRRTASRWPCPRRRRAGRSQQAARAT